ncbi:MAG: hypothetical protein ACOYXT_09165 [Bacteroidota bacterium]
MRALLVVLLIPFLYSCASSGENANAKDFYAGEKLAELRNEKIQEASGLASSITHRGYLWTHNDSGNPPEIFLVDETLAVRLTCVLSGVENRDWEDISVGPGPEPGKNYIYVADIGDNMAQYRYKHIFRFEEPLLKEGITETIITDFDSISFRLPDGIKDTEALMIDPTTKDLFVVSKREEPVVVYRVPYPYATTDSLVAETVTTLPLTQIVAGDISADGREVIMKNYQNIYYWEVGEGQSVSDALKGKPKVLPYEEEPQGEALAFARDGSGYFTISEKKKDEKSYLYFYKRK